MHVNDILAFFRTSYRFRWKPISNDISTVSANDFFFLFNFILKPNNKPLMENYFQDFFIIITFFQAFILFLITTDINASRLCFSCSSRYPLRVSAFYGSIFFFANHLPSLFPFFHVFKLLA